jgi:hypothetical protein
MASEVEKLLLINTAISLGEGFLFMPWAILKAN